MPAKIVSLIPPQSFELVRDSIFQILANEIPSQYALSANDESLNADVFLERQVPLNYSEIPAVVVSVGDIDSSDTSDGGQSVVDSDPTVLYHIDCYQKAETTPTERGDTIARLRLHRLMGVVRAILTDAQYKFLNPNTVDVLNPPPLKGIVDRGRIINMMINDIGKQDAVSTVMGRLVFEIRMSEVHELISTNTIEGSDTVVGFYLSNEGYKFTV